MFTSIFIKNDPTSYNNFFCYTTNNSSERTAHACSIPALTLDATKLLAATLHANETTAGAPPSSTLLADDSTNIVDIIKLCIIVVSGDATPSHSRRHS